MQLNFFLVSQNDKPFPGYDFQSNSFSASKVYRHGYGISLNVEGKVSLIHAAEEAADYYSRKFSNERRLQVLGVRTNNFFDLIDLDSTLNHYFSDGDTVVVTVDRRPNYKSPIPAILKALTWLSFIHVVHVAIVSLVVIFGVRNRFFIGNLIQQIYNL
ncbi:hypothetical protein FT663_03651 [Candidozyma haemuli var. vulneris]|uniref:Uncharacterized protein n=1 Tax=Candidozyma haemuli TaxID=45357 RepID=A0A2V1AY63_9ASCO|nr:hypothetical protein CXQ85_002452 [[Candida] haemuloni]KAF3985795.1 hypothetical protein FT662_04937 [[Candida] haemuloni var. vulneris]KAF3989375.1 hypothetical protein FT663_03651 [[Candida] haemuloni var. vulneris]PVH22734.1 hypothetical protein CXQ85_002452 [[Candida] haemuloni]